MYATVSDLEARWRTLTPEEQARAEVLLEDAAVRLDAACPPSDPPTVQELAARKIVSCEMVKRAMVTGSSGSGGLGVTSVQQGAGPYQETVQFSNPTGDLYLTKADRSLLGCGKQRAFMIDLAPVPPVPPVGEQL
ncbi:Gp19/Gp15/Gp42 family protein [Microbacterium sp. KNMS]